MNNDSRACRRTVKLISLALAFITGFLEALPADAGTPLQVQTETANGVMLGTWNTHVEYDDAMVVAGTSVIVSDNFERQAAGWWHDGGDWHVTNGVLRQISGATPALTRFPFKHSATNYTVSVRAKKLSGAEGFLVGFGARDSENYYWLNLGGWNNTASAVEKALDGERSPIGPRVSEVIETDRWYDLKVEVTGPRIQCFVDGRRIIDLNDAESGRGESTSLPPVNDKLHFGRALIPDMAADPSIVEIDGTFYCYATTDGWGQGLATSGTPVVWKSKDFLNWSFEGSSFSSDFDLKYWAPSTVVRKNGRYYSFPTLDGKITAVVADSPLGPFVAPDGQHVTKATLQPFPIEQNSTIDAEVFIDDDGQAYMVWSRRRMVKLKPDLLSPDGPVINLPTKREGYSEGPFLTKRNGIYYYFYTLGGNEVYQYAYLMSRTSPLGPWETPEQDIIATTDHGEKVFGPGHGCFFHPQGSDQWYFIYLEYGRGSTMRQIFADKMNFNPDGTIQPIKLTKAGVSAIRPVANATPNLARDARATASSTRPNDRVRPRSDRSLNRVETFAPTNALDEFNGTRWMAEARDTNAWFQVDLGAPRNISRTESYFVKPAAGHAYRLEWSLDGATWQLYSGHEEVILRSPHRDEKSVRARYLKLTLLKGEPGLWEFRVYGEPGQPPRASGAADAPPAQWGDWPRGGDQGDGTYRNPVLPSDYSDIDCIRVGSDYYAISSTFQYSPGMVILHSKDLVNWRILSHVIDDVTQIGPELNWDRMNRYGHGVWAGAIRYHAGKFWVYFGTPDEGYFMSTAKDPAGPWESLQRVMDKAGWDDCCPFWDDDGQGYFVGTNFKDGYKTWLFKLTADGRDLVPGWRVLLNEGSGREANKLYKINGTYYHLYSEHKPGVGRYVMMQRSTNITGPYTEKCQLSHAQPEVHEPNQGGIVQTEQGNWYFFTHHGAGDWEGRCASLLPVTWVDGWPVLGEVGSDGIGKMVWSGRKPVSGTPMVTPQTDDDFHGSKLGAQWEWNYQPRADKWSLAERPGFLRLHAFKPLERDNLKKAGNTLTQRSLRTSTNVVTLVLDLGGMANGQVAGLCHYSKNFSTIEVRRQNGILTLESARDRTITNGPVLNTPKIWLRSTWGLDGKSSYSYSTNGTFFTPFGESYQLGWGDYRGDRIGLFTYNNEAEAGHVDVDSFTYNYRFGPNSK